MQRLSPTQKGVLFAVVAVVLLLASSSLSPSNEDDDTGSDSGRLAAPVVATHVTMPSKMPKASKEAPTPSPRVSSGSTVTGDTLAHFSSDESYC